MTYLKLNPDHKTPLSKLRFNPMRALRKSSRDFKRGQSGVAAIEFALIAPIMIGIYFGLAEIAAAINIDRSISHTANVVGDLATQTTQVINDDVEEIFAAAIRVLNLRDVGNVTIELASYQMDTQTPPQPELIGMATLNPGIAPLTEFKPEDVDTRILNTTSGVVVARIGYNYTPLMLRYTNDTIQLKETFLLKPRRSASVPIGDDINNPVRCSAVSPTSVSCSNTI